MAAEQPNVYVLAGARVVVCEARHKTGGAAATDQPWPDHPEFKVTTLSYVMSLMPDGRVLIEYDDPKQNYEGFAEISKADADALERWDAWIGGLAMRRGLSVRPVSRA